MASEAYICDFIRTPIGRYGGVLAKVRPDNLATIPLKALVERNKSVDWSKLDEVYFGCANQAGEDNRNVARMALLLAGLPNSIPGATINRLCASGMEAIGMAARAIKAGEIELAIAGGVESMSRAPFVMGKAEEAFARKAEIFDTTIGWRFINPLMKAQYGVDSMPETGENVAEEFQVSREDQDKFALRSQQRAVAAQKRGYFAAETVAVEPNWRTRLLAVITDPSIALILMMIGIYGLLFEFSHPGFALPGILGGICLLLALYAFQLLPINYAGLGLILLGIALMVGEAFVPSFGVLGIGGIAAFVIGAVILIDADIPGYGVPLGLIVPLSAFSAAALFFVVTMALKARRRPVVSGRDEMIGASGEVLEDFTGEGWARVHSETWRVSSAAPLKAGQSVRVTGVRGLVLAVKPEGGES